jgi:hypothetical protein
MATPEMTAWRDFKSGYFVCDVHCESSNSDHIFKTYRKVVKQFGAPSDIITDNGPDFIADDFTGGRRGSKKNIVIEQHRLSMCAKMGTRPHQANPYRGQSKPIERDFRYFEEKLVKAFTGYKGNSVANKPESLKKALAAGNVKTFDEFKKFVDDFVDDMNRRIISSGYRKGKSPLQILQEELPEAARRGLVRKVDDAQLKLLCYRTSRPMTVRRNQIYDGECGVAYYADWVLGQNGRKVYLRRDYDDVSDALAYDYATNEFLGAVSLDKDTPALAKTAHDKATLSKRLNENKLKEKVVRMMADPGMDISPEERTAAYRRFVRSQENKEVAEAGIPSIDDTDAPALMTCETNVIRKKAEMEKEGEQDLSVYRYDLDSPASASPIYITDSEIEEAAAAGEPEAIAILERRKKAV